MSLYTVQTREELAAAFLLSLFFFFILLIFWQLSASLNHTLKKFRQDQGIIHQSQGQLYGPSYSKYPFLLGFDYLIENGRNILNYSFAEGTRGLLNRLGPTYSARIALRKVVVTIDPENLKAIMQTHFADYTIIPARAKLVQRLFGNGAFATEGHEWVWSRHLTSAGLSGLDLRPEILEKHLAPMLLQIQNASAGGHLAVIDFATLASRFSWGVSSDAMFGDTDEDRKLERARFADSYATLAYMARYLTIFNNQMPWLADLAFWGTFRPAQRQMFQYVDDRSKEALQVLPYKRPTTLVEGIAAKTSNVERIRSETLNLLLAGHDSIRIVLGELFYLLARHPAVWAKVQAEVATLNGQHPTLSELRKLEYVNWCINESMRLRPTLSVHGRLSTNDTVLPRGGGPSGSDPLIVTKGTYVVYSNYALHRNPAVFGPEDVDAFIPERWSHVAPKQYEYLSFGTGPRRCPGRNIGYHMLAYAFVRLAQEVEYLEPIEGEKEWQEVTAFSFTNRHGHWLRMKPRHQAINGEVA